MEDDQVYLDINATTPLEPHVLDSIHEALRDGWGNPSSSHKSGVKAKHIIQKARESVAVMIGAVSEDIVFTSGGTEANNMILRTAIKYFWDTFPCRDKVSNKDKLRPHFVTSNLEHDSVRLTLEMLQKEGLADVTFVPASKTSGQVLAEDVMTALRPTTCMVTIMTANNETGIIQPVAKIAERVRSVRRNPEVETRQILLHTDAAQAIGKINVDVSDLCVDYLTIVGHKFYGPRVGALFCKGLGTKSNPLYPMLYGGGQERNYRPGTENTGMIAGLGKAAEMVTNNLSKYENHMKEIRDYLEAELEKSFPGRVHFNARYLASCRIPNTCSVSILGPNFQGNKVLALLRHTLTSTGAACHSSAGSRASPVLLASGVAPDVAINALRVSVGRHTTTRDIDVFLTDLRNAVSTLTTPDNKSGAT